MNLEELAQDIAAKCAAKVPTSIGVRAFDFLPLIREAVAKAYAEGRGLVIEEYEKEAGRPDTAPQGITQ